MMCLVYLITLYIFFFKQKTAYEVSISDWSSDVCSSDLQRTDWPRAHAAPAPPIRECARQISPATHVRLSHRTCTRSANEPMDWRHAALAGGAPTAVPARSARPDAATDLRHRVQRRIAFPAAAPLWSSASAPTSPAYPSGSRAA